MDSRPWLKRIQTVVVLGIVLAGLWLGRTPIRRYFEPLWRSQAARQMGSANPAAPEVTRPERAPVQIDPTRQQLIGVRSEPVEYRELTKTIRTVGRVELDETRIAHVHTKVSGWVRQVFVNYTWQHVRGGEPLFTLYSPELVSAQQEYLIARRAQDYLGQAPYREVAQGAEALLRAARERLKLWDVTDEQIAELERRGTPQEELTIYSPATGHVTERSVFQNQYIQPDTRLYTIADHTRVWVHVDIYEKEIPFVRLGQAATLTLESFPGEVFRGGVTYIWPHLEHMTRTLKLRLEFDNPELKLKPEMYGNVELRVGLGRKLAVPESAVIDTGSRQLVFLDRGQGTFEPREVRLGPKVAEYYQVREGLRAGERVLTSATFLIDSESQLRAALAGLQLSTVVTEVGRGTPGAAAAAQLEFSSNPSPPRRGSNELIVRLRDASGRPVEDAEVTVSFYMPAMPAMEMGAMQEQAQLSPAGGGEYRGRLELPTGGTWQVSITARRQGQVVASKQFSLAAQ